MQQLLRKLREAAYVRYSQHVIHAVLVEGTLKGAGLSFRCLFVENSDFREYVCSKMFDPPVIASHQRILIRGLEKYMSGRPDIDLCIAVLPRRFESDFQKNHCYKTREWVHQILDLSTSWEEIQKGFHQNAKAAFRKIRKHGFTYRISSDRKDFDHFYYRMFLPHIRTRHGTARLDRYEEVLPFFLKGFLVLILKDGHPISAALCYPEDETVIFRRIGVLDGSEDYMKQGAQSAVYSAMIRHAKENGFKALDLMYSRPFLTDGVFRHKTQWGARAYPHKEPESCVFFFIPRPSARVAAFFEYNPLIVNAGEGLDALSGWTDTGPPSAEEIAMFGRKYYSPGLNALLLMKSDQRNVIRCPFAPPGMSPLERSEPPVLTRLDRSAGQLGAS